MGTTRTMFALLLVACACAVLAADPQPSAVGGFVCATASSGYCGASIITEHDRIEPQQIMRRYVVTDECREQGGVTGWQMMACDRNVKPLVMVPNVREATVYRYSDLNSYVGVTSQVCCRY